jgi:two-component system chemotaxis sensor kinase CheA
MSVPPSDLTLDDVATLLLQLEPEDRDDLARAREQLADLAFGNRVGIAVQPLVAKAVKALKPLAEGTAADPAAAYAEVCALVERAMDATAAGPAAKAPPAAPAAAPAPAPTSMPDVEPAAPADERLPTDLDLDLLRDFLVESRECLGGSEAALLALEARPDDVEAVNTVFRAFHTVKGTSAFLGLDRVTAFAHEAESLLARVREGALAYTRGCADLALRATDMLKALLGAVEATLRAEGPGGRLVLPEGYGPLVEAIVGFDGEGSGAGDQGPGGSVTPAAAPAARAADADPVSAAPDPRSLVPDPQLVDRRQGDRRQGDRRQGGAAAAAAAADAEQFVRVRTDRLDRLIDMVGELVIAQTMIAGDSAMGARADDRAAADGQALAKKIAHAGKIVRELQELAMGMRMVPLRATFQKLTRLVRDVSAKLGKEVEFVAEGEDTEIDRTMADVIGDPLVHMLRNALDHGLEPGDAREAAGKPRRGRVRLSAQHAGGAVVVSLSDDGRGLDRERIARKAAEKGLIESDRGMSDAEVYALIFAPGFSTAEQLTDVSGRGVGMDVVKRNIEKVRGRVEIESRLGEGTTFTVRLPLTLAVADGMLVRVGAERYVVPTTNIHMSFRPEPGMLHTVGGRGEVVTLRGEVMPVVRLHALFNIGGAERDPSRAILMLVGDGRRKTALLVDELLGQHQVVVKALGDGVGRVAGVAGGAILGDGRVGLIVDVAEIVALAERGEALGAAA